VPPGETVEGLYRRMVDDNRVHKDIFRAETARLPRAQRLDHQPEHAARIARWARRAGRAGAAQKADSAQRRRQTAFGRQCPSPRTGNAASDRA
jgi:hypothetical protein